MRREEGPGMRGHLLCKSREKADALPRMAVVSAAEKDSALVVRAGRPSHF